MRKSIPASVLDDTAFFIALFATALALGAALAHALELPNKFGLSQAEYFTVQQIYRGWNLLGLLLAVELFGILALVARNRQQPRVLWLLLLALALLVAAQAIFWIFTFPANKATANWTIPPANWEHLRRQWEFSHLAGAVCQGMAMAALIVAAL